MCEFYNLDEAEVKYIPLSKENDEPKVYELKSGDIISLNFKGLMELLISDGIGRKFKFLGKEWMYKKKLFTKLKLPKWGIFGFDTYKFMVR